MIKKRSYLSFITPEIKYILLFFLITRIVLTGIGITSRIILEPYQGKGCVRVYSEHLPLDIWGVWDTGWYLNIAEHGYSPIPSKNPGIEGQTNLAFFPLYPLLMRAFGKFIGDYYIAGLIISNISFLIACIFLYKLVRLEFDHDTALQSIKFLFLFPVSFILSGVFTESLFLCLVILCFYYAKRGNWLITGILGFFLSLTRSLGVLVIVPLLYEYFRGTHERKRWEILFLFFIPLGLLSFMAYNYHVTGDFLSFAHIQTSWGRTLSNPLAVLWDGLLMTDGSGLFSACFPGFTLILFIVFFKKIGFSYWIYGFYSVMIPLSFGLQSMPRFTLVIFPLYIIMAKLSKKETLDHLMTAALALSQGFLMVFWSNGFPLVI